MSTIKNCGVLILAAGKSERMNFPKAFLLFEGQTFLEKIALEYHTAGIKKISVVINKEHDNDQWKKYIKPLKSIVTFVKNPEPERGRFHSLKLGIKNMPAADFMFIHNVDNPFIDDDTIEKLWENRNPDGYTVILNNGRKGHPLLISKKVIQRIDHMEDNDFNLRDVLMDFPKQEVETRNAGVLMNINTPEDYKKLSGKNNRTI